MVILSQRACPVAFFTMKHALLCSRSSKVVGSGAAVVGELKILFTIQGDFAVRVNTLLTYCALRRRPMGNLDRFENPSGRRFKADPIEPSEGLLRFPSTPPSTTTRG